MSNFNISQFTQQVCDYQKNLITSFLKNKPKKPINVDVSQLQLDKTKIMELFIKNMGPIELPIKTNININTEKKNKKNKKIPKKLKIKSLEPSKHSEKKITIKKNQPSSHIKKCSSNNKNNKNNKIIIKKKYMQPSDFNNNYEYFIYMCNKLKQDYYRYKTNLWDGPAMIIKENTDLCKKLKNKINIDLNFDILINKCMAVYPSKYCSPNCISYTKEYVVCEDANNTKQQIDVIEWNFNDRTYLLDTYTNNVYDPDTELKIGVRKYNDNEKWSIVHPN
jgi:hypothetical protein